MVCVVICGMWMVCVFYVLWYYMVCVLYVLWYVSNGRGGGNVYVYGMRMVCVCYVLWYVYAMCIVCV